MPLEALAAVLLLVELADASTLVVVRPSWVETVLVTAMVAADWCGGDGDGSGGDGSGSGGSGGGGVVEMVVWWYQ